MVAALSLEFAWSCADPTIGSHRVAQRIVDGHAVRAIQYVQGVGTWYPCHTEYATQGVRELIAEQDAGLQSQVDASHLGRLRLRNRLLTFQRQVRKHLVRIWAAV